MSFRSSRAIAKSRCAWPRPTDEETYRARGRPIGAVHCRIAARARAPDRVLREVAQRQVDLDRLAGRGGSGRPRAITSSWPPVSLASARPSRNGVIRSRSSRITNTGQRRSHARSGSAARLRFSSPRAVAINVSGSVSSAHPIPSSIPLVECGSEKHREMNQRANPRVVLAPDARPWADRARSELAATGETLRRRDPTTLDELTPQELQIALLLAGGKTKREAVAALFLSPKTIEYHLRHVYLKLGIHSRDELAQALALDSVQRAGRYPPRAPDRRAGTYRPSGAAAKAACRPRNPRRPARAGRCRFGE